MALGVVNEASGPSERIWVMNIYFAGRGHKVFEDKRARKYMRKYQGTWRFLFSFEGMSQSKMDWVKGVKDAHAASLAQGSVKKKNKEN